MLGAIMLRLMTVFMLWLAWTLGAAPWVNLIRSVVDPAAGWGEVVLALGATLLWTAVVAAAAVVLLGLHMVGTVFSLTELVLGVKADHGARWLATGSVGSEAAFDAIGGGLLIWWGWAGLGVDDDAVRVFAGVTLGAGLYFATAAVLRLVTSRRSPSRALTAWEAESLQTVSMTVAAFVSLSIAGLAAARGVDDSLPEIVHADGVRPIALGERIDPCSYGDCEGARAFAIRIPESGMAYLRTRDQDECVFGPWAPDGGPLVGPSGQTVEFEWPDSWADWGKIGLWLEGEPGEVVEFAVGACMDSFTVVEAV